MATTVTDLTLTCLYGFLPFFSFFFLPNPGQSFSICTSCCSEWQFVLTHVDVWTRLFVCVCVRASKRAETMERKNAPGLMMCSSRFTNEKAPLFACKDNAILICKLGAWLECFGYPLSLSACIKHSTHTQTDTHTLRTYTLAHECIPDIIQVVVRWLPEHMFLVSLQFHEY